MEKEFEVQVFTVVKMCSECETGEMRCTGQGRSNNFGSFYEHICINCSFEEMFENQYPKIKYKRIEQKSITKN